jgi:hypothetical protein
VTSLTASRNPIRVGAVAAIFAGLCIAGHGIPTMFDKNPMDLDSPADYLMEIIFGAGYAALLIFFGTLLRLRTGGGTNVYGRLGRVGAYAGMIGSVLIMAKALLIVVLGATFGDQDVKDILVVIFGLYIVGSSLASLLGPVLLGIATLRASLLPRWIGLALVIVPLALLIAQFISSTLAGYTPYVEGPFWIQTPNSIGDALWLVAIASLAVGIVGFHTLQKDHYGRIVRAGFYTVIVAALAEVLGSIVLLSGSTVLEWLVFPIGSFGVLVGLVLYGTATLQARVLPLWCGVGLIVGLPIRLALLPIEPWGLVLFGLLWLALGFVLWSRGATEQPARVS